MLKKYPVVVVQKISFKKERLDEVMLKVSILSFLREKKKKHCLKIHLVFDHSLNIDTYAVN